MARELKAVHLIGICERKGTFNPPKKKIRGNIFFAVVKHLKECKKGVLFTDLNP